MVASWVVGFGSFEVLTMASGVRNPKVSKSLHPEIPIKAPIRGPSP